MIRRAAPRRWAFKHETQMCPSTLLHSPAYTNWRPDCLAYDPDTDTIHQEIFYLVYCNRPNSV
eukprot:605209-Rhodomonas_salina.1